jgi:CARDB protein
MNLGRRLKGRQEGKLLLSFLDEPDEPARSRRRPPRGPSTDRQTLMLRRTLALVGGVIVLILFVLLVRGCLNARKENAIKDYSTDSAELLRESKEDGDQLFNLLEGKGGTDQATAIINQLNGYRTSSSNRVDRAEALDVPGDLSGAQEELLEVLELRRDGFADITDALQVALGDQDRRQGSDDVAKQMQVFLASDIVDTQRFRPKLFAVLRDQSLSAPDLPKKGFVPDIQWLQPDFVADQVNALRTGTGGGGAAAPGLHGNGIAGVSLGGTALAPGGSASVQLTGDLSFQIQVQNQGENTETDVVVRVTVGDGGDADTQEETIPTIAAGELKTVTIPISKQPPTGQNVPIKVEVKPVPGEQKTDNNTQESSVIFTR